MASVEPLAGCARLPSENLLGIVKKLCFKTADLSEFRSGIPRDLPYPPARKLPLKRMASGIPAAGCPEIRSGLMQAYQEYPPDLRQWTMDSYRF
jgi:hypothetical protein